MSTKGNNISQITDYLKGKLDARAMYELERNAQDDPFLMDALDGYETIGKDQDANLAELKSRLAERVAGKKDRNILLWRILPIAASLFLLIGGYWLFEYPAKQQQANNVTRINHHKPAIGVTKKPSVPGKVEEPVNDISHLAKNRASHIPSLSKTENKLAGIDENVASKNNLAVARNGKGFYGGAVASAVKNIPANVLEKAQVNDNYAFKTSTPNRNKEIFGNAYLNKGKDTGTSKYLYTDLSKAKSSKNPYDTTTGVYGKAHAHTGDMSIADIQGNVKIDQKQPPYLILGNKVQDNPVGNVEQLLQGRVAKLDIHNTGAPGTRGAVNIRGLASAPGSVPANTPFRLISGKVTDTAGTPLAGVSVRGGNTNLTSTDANGRYRILVNKDSAVIVTGLGYQAQSHQIKPGQSTLDVKLKEGSQALAEINIRGYVKRTRDQTTGSSYIITGKDGKCKENARFKRRFFAKIAIAEQYITEHAKRDSVFTVRDGKFLRALKFIAKRAPTTITADKTAYGYADLKIFAQNKERWLHWYALSKCNNLK